jgi:hypothetical protein
MSAVRMVAYGVLEMKHKDPKEGMWFRELSPEEQERLRSEDFERDQLRKLVSDELKKYGLLLIRQVTPKGMGWRTKANAHVLYGQLQGPEGFHTRPTLHEGDFKSCCVVAAKILDELNAAQET